MFLSTLFGCTVAAVLSFAIALNLKNLRIAGMAYCQEIQRSHFSYGKTRAPLFNCRKHPQEFDVARSDNLSYATMKHCRTRAFCLPDPFRPELKHRRTSLNSTQRLALLLGQCTASKPIDKRETNPLSFLLLVSRIFERPASWQVISLSHLPT